MSFLQVVRTLNNLEQVFQTVSRLPYQMGIDANAEANNNNGSDKVPRASTSSSNSACGGSDGGDNNVDNDGGERSPMELVSSALDHLDIVVYTVLETLQGKLQTGLRKHTFHLAWSPDSLPTRDAISPLVDFLDERIQIANAVFLR